MEISRCQLGSVERRRLRRPLDPEPSHCTSCGVTATGIEWGATLAVASGRKREPQATEEGQPKRLSVESGVCCSGETREWQTCRWASLRTEELSGREEEVRSHSPTQETVVHFPGSSELPPVSFGVVQFVLPGLGASLQIFPRGARMSLLDSVQTICPTCPIRGGAHPGFAAQPPKICQRSQRQAIHAAPHGGIVVSGILVGHFGRNAAGQIDSCHAEDQEKPSRLQIWNRRDTLPQHAVGIGHSPHVCLQKLGVPQRGLSPPASVRACQPLGGEPPFPRQ